MASTRTGQVIWITGLSGAGKSTMATLLAARLRQQSAAVALLDGDELRTVFAKDQMDGQHHDRSSRLQLAMQYSALCRLLADQGLTVVIATMSLFHEVQQWNRRYLPRYFEIYLKVPLSELQRRDPKGIYRKFAQGETRQVAGLDLAVDEPQAPDLLLEFSNTTECSVDIFFQRLCLELEQQGLNIGISDSHTAAKPS
ncbi:MAG: adenylyl-sulfate kinase [Gammaproteobacteria bacterium]|nr:adenylyl-sulfate kinase [Gammaproteobacteria bacterium]